VINAPAWNRSDPDDACNGVVVMVEREFFYFFSAGFDGLTEFGAATGLAKFELDGASGAEGEIAEEFVLL
jgi:hypothetical protein